MTIVDAERDGLPEHERFDVCVIGAGPAGLTIATELVSRGFSVAVVAGGRLTADRADEDHGRGGVTSHHFLHDGIAGGRRRGFGGTARAWVYEGSPPDGRRRVRLLPPREIDLEARDERGARGWPIGRGELEPFLKRAYDRFALGPYDYEPAHYATPDAPTVPGAHGDLQTVMCHFGASDIFTLRLRDDLIGAVTATVIIGATVVGLDAGPGATRIEAVRLAVRGRGAATVRADQFVLCTGGIENARLLLEAALPGVANGPDAPLGRYLTDHPEFRLGVFQPADPQTLRRLGLYDLRWTPFGLVSGMLAVTSAAQQRDGLLDAGAKLIGRSRSTGSPAERALKRLVRGRGRTVRRDGPVLLQDPAAAARTVAMRTLRRGAGFDERHGGWSTSSSMGSAPVIELVGVFEMAPRAANRITLTAERDGLGARRPHADLDLDPADIRRMRLAADLIVSELAEARLGTFVPWVDLEEAARPTFPGLHHPMGTTRMDDDPRQGVVDRNLRVHELDNLFVAGSSVFPNGLGFANPTLTLVALSMRLADHLGMEAAR